jgi:cobalt/nickel transport protein
MSMNSRMALALALVVCFGASLADAHYGILLPNSWSADRGREVLVTFRWGHPFEHELFDAAPPESVALLNPDGTRTDLTKSVKKIAVSAGDGKMVTAYEVRFTPTQRGDHVVTLNAPPVWMESDREFWQDTIRVVVHVATQNGWDGATGKGFELVPMTRPYGLRPGHVFQGQALLDGKPAAGSVVEVERLNDERPKELPPDEHVTRTVKTDANGTATCTLDAAGWWCLTARRDAGTREREGKDFPLRHRATLWVYVDAPAK